MIKKIIGITTAVSILISSQIISIAENAQTIPVDTLIPQNEQEIQPVITEDEMQPLEPVETENVQPMDVQSDLVDERYHDPANKAYHFDQFSLGALGWSETEKNGGSGEFSGESGNLIIKKTSGASSGDTSLVYDVNKRFIYTEYSWKGDDRISVRTDNFKGNYSIELTGSFQQTGSQVYYDILGRDNTGKECSVGRYRIDPGTNGAFSVYNNKLNGANTNQYPLWTNPKTKRTITTRIDSETSTFQTFVDGNTDPVSTTVSGAQPADTFNMTDWNTRNPGAYITGIRISAQGQEAANTTIASIESLKLIENSKIEDMVDTAVNSMNMGLLTDTPQSVDEDLNPLPAEIAGANITWTSSHPDLIADDGTLVNMTDVPKDIIMTAKVVNPYDGFTKYVDFRVTLAGKDGYIGFDEEYLMDFVGEPSCNGNPGTISMPVLPNLTFSYNGIQNAETHNSQIFVNNGLLIFRKISDRQTPNYGECLTAVKEIAGTNENLTDNSPLSFTFEGKANGTGKFTIALLDQDEKALFRIHLDASTKKIIVDYGGHPKGGGYQEISKVIDDIDPTVEHKYTIFKDRYTDVYLDIDDKYIDLYNNDHAGDFLPTGTSYPRVAFLKMSISNITYADTNMGFVKKVFYREGRQQIGSLEKEKKWLDQYMSTHAIVKNIIELPSKIVSGTTVTWTSSDPSILSNEGIVNTDNIEGKTAVITLTAKISNGYNTLTVPYTVTVYNTGIWKTPKLFKINYNGAEFYSNILDHGYLYKGNSPVYQNLSTWLALCGNEIYFNANGLKRINCATGEVTSVLDGVNPYYIVSDGSCVYYSNWRDGGRLYRYRISDGANEKICDDIGYELEIRGEYLYYQNGLDQMLQYKILKSATNAQTGMKEE